MSRPIALLSAGHDANSSFLKGPARAPEVIRRLLHSESGNACAENAVNVLDAIEDHGNMAAPSTRDGVMALEQGVRQVANQGLRPITLGGDHAITHPLVRGLATEHGEIDILHFDAHADLYPLFDNNPYSHASPFARLLESGCVSRLVQVGIRTLTPEQLDVIERYSVECHRWAGDIDEISDLRFERPLYISIDMDALDPAFAPGVSHHEPGGMTVRDVLNVLDGVQGDLIGCDVVEYNPLRDINDMTGMVCVKFVKELASKILSCLSLSK